MRTLVFAVFVVWGLAVAVKAVAALRTQRGYTFAGWDAGLLRAGSTLNRGGTILKVAIGVLMAAACGAQLANLVPYDVGLGALITIAAVSVLSDLVTRAKKS